MDTDERVTGADCEPADATPSCNSVTASGCGRGYTTDSRNAGAETQAALEAHERILAAAHGGMDSKERERRRRNREAARFGTHYGDCGAALAPDAPVWLIAQYVSYSRMGHSQRWQTPICKRCRPTPSYGRHGRWCAPQPCESCGRPVHYRPSYRRRHVLCSSRCAWLAASKRRSATTGAARHKACAVCGTVFDPPRADARYCSPACRQRAYRQRKDA